MNEFFAFLAGLLAAVPGLGAAPEPAWNGYVEANFVYVAPMTGGIIAEIDAAQGETVAAGDVLVRLDDRQSSALLRAAEARVEAARAAATSCSPKGWCRRPRPIRITPRSRAPRRRWRN